MNKEFFIISWFLFEKWLRFRKSIDHCPGGAIRHTGANRPRTAKSRLRRRNAEGLPRQFRRLVGCRAVCRIADDSSTLETMEPGRNARRGNSRDRCRFGARFSRASQSSRALSSVHSHHGGLAESRKSLAVRKSLTKCDAWRRSSSHPSDLSCGAPTWSSRVRVRVRVRPFMWHTNLVK